MYVVSTFSLPMYTCWSCYVLLLWCHNYCLYVHHGPITCVAFVTVFRFCFLDMLLYCFVYMYLFLFVRILNLILISPITPTIVSFVKFLFIIMMLYFHSYLLHTYHSIFPTVSCLWFSVLVCTYLCSYRCNKIFLVVCCYTVFIIWVVYFCILKKLCPAPPGREFLCCLCFVFVLFFDVFIS